MWKHINTLIFNESIKYSTPIQLQVDQSLSDYAILFGVKSDQIQTGRYRRAHLGPVKIVRIHDR